MRLAHAFWAASLTMAVLTSSVGPARAQGLGAYPQDHDEPPRVYRRRPPLTVAAARTWLVLARPIPLPFERPEPLEDVLKYIKRATAAPNSAGLAILVDPVALRKGGATTTSTVAIDVEGIPLANALGLVLKQLNLGFGVQKDGLLFIGDPATIPRSESRPVTEPQALTWVALGRKVDIPFEKPASLEAALKFVKGASRGKVLPDGLAIYLEPISLAEHDIAPGRESIVFNVPDVPLSSALDLMLRQWDLVFHIDPDGIVVIEHKETEDGEGDEEVADLPTIEALRREVAQLRRGFAISRAWGPTLQFRVAGGAK